MASSGLGVGSDLVARSRGHKRLFAEWIVYRIFPNRLHSTTWATD